MKSTQIFVCPDNSVPNGAVGTNYTVVCSYFLNRALNTINTGNVQPRSIATLNAPASTVLLGEVYQGCMNGMTSPASPQPLDIYSPAGDGNFQANSSAGYRTGVMGNRGTFANSTFTDAAHTEGSNFLACDGHAKWAHAAAVSSGAANAAIAPLPTDYQGQQNACVRRRNQQHEGRCRKNFRPHLQPELITMSAKRRTIFTATP